MTEQDFRKVVSNNLSAYRKLNNLTQLELAEKLNYSDKSVSKWERGDGLPDAFVLKTIADFYGITLNDLVSIGKPKRHKHIRRKHVIIPLLSAAIVWLVAVIVFMVLNMLPTPVAHADYTFIYAIPATAVVFTVFACLWWNQILQLLTVSSIIWSVALSIYISISIHGIHLIWFVATVVQVMAILWFILVLKISTKPKNKEDK